MSDKENKPVYKVKQSFINMGLPLTITDLRRLNPDLKANQLSMTLCYLMRARWVTRTKVPTTFKRGHQMIYSYTYHNERLPKA
jgi:hypothetical protein